MHRDYGLADGRKPTKVLMARSSKHSPRDRIFIQVAYFDKDPGEGGRHYLT